MLDEDNPYGDSSPLIRKEDIWKGGCRRYCHAHVKKDIDQSSYNYDSAHHTSGYHSEQKYWQTGHTYKRHWTEYSGDHQNYGSYKWQEQEIHTDALNICDTTVCKDKECSESCAQNRPSQLVILSIGSIYLLKQIWVRNMPKKKTDKECQTSSQRIHILRDTFTDCQYKSEY